MISIVNFMNRFLTLAFDLICWPFMTLPPIWAMTVISLVSGIAMVWVFGKISDQAIIKALREQIRGNLIGVRLFQSDLSVSMRLQRRIFSDTMRYMKHALIPMVILSVPVLLIMSQLNLRFAVRPATPGEQILVKAFVRDTQLLDRPVMLETEPTVIVETPGVRIPLTREVTWRVRAQRAGQHEITIHIGEQTLKSHLIAGNRWGPVPQRRSGRGAIDTLLYPGAPPIPTDHNVEAVEIGYQTLQLRIFGWTVHWLVAFLTLSIVFGFAFKGLIGVEI